MSWQSSTRRARCTWGNAAEAKEGNEPKPRQSGGEALTRRQSDAWIKVDEGPSHVTSEKQTLEK